MALEADQFRLVPVLVVPEADNPVGTPGGAAQLPLSPPPVLAPPQDNNTIDDPTKMRSITQPCRAKPRRLSIKQAMTTVGINVYGEYEELPEPKYAAERRHASSLLAKRHLWCLNALGERQMRVGENSIQPFSASAFTLYPDCARMKKEDEVPVRS